MFGTGVWDAAKLSVQNWAESIWKEEVRQEGCKDLVKMEGQKVLVWDLGGNPAPPIPPPAAAWSYGLSWDFPYSRGDSCSHRMLTMSY